MSYQQVPLLSPGLIQGFATAQEPKSLPAGGSPLSGGRVAASLGNVRLGDGVVHARWGDATVKSGLSATPRGAFECTLDGSPYLFRAKGDGTHVDIEKSTDGGTTWATITASSVVYGDTRLTDSTTKSVRFCVVRDNPSLSFETYDCLLIQNGINEPLMYAKAVTGSSAFTPGNYGLSIVTQPSQPTASTDLVSSISFGSYINIKGATSLWTNVAGHIEGSNYAVGGFNFYELDVLTSYAAGDQATVHLTIVGAPNLTGSQRIILLAENDSANVQDFWQNVKIECSSNGSDWSILVDPMLGTSVFLETTGAFASGAAYQIGSPIVVGTGSLAAVQYLRFTWLTDTPTGSTQKGYLYAAAPQGSVQGGAQFAMAYGGTDSRTIGPAQFVSSTASVSAAAMNASPFVSALQIQDDERFYFNYSILGNNPVTAQKDAGIDRIFLYRRDVGEDDWYLISSMRVCVWNSGLSRWDYASGTSGSQIAITASAAADQDLSRPILDPAAIVLPTSSAMAFANGRVWAGSGQRLYVSDFDSPWVFRMAANVDNPGSGTSIGFAGQTVEAIVPLGAFGAAAEELSTPVAGVATVFVLTDRNLWELSGFSVDSLSRPIPRAPYGTLSPLSVGRSRLGFYWLTDKNQVAYMSPQGLELISLARVDDQLAAIPAAMKAWTVGAVANDRYYLGYSNAGATPGSSNAKMLVWSEHLRTWESIDTASAGSFEFLVPYNADGYVKLLRFGSTSVYEHEKPGSTAGVDLKIVFRQLHQGGLKGLDAGDFTVWLESGDYTLTLGRAFPGGTANGTVDASAGELLVDTAGTGGGGTWVQPSIAGLVPGGTKIFAAYLAIEETPSPAMRP